MLLTTPRRDWAGSDVYIIGGGPSLRGFDWRRLFGCHTIGLNHAYQLGALVCSLCFFSDANFWEENREGLESFAAPVVTHLEGVTAPWVCALPRREGGLHHDALGYGNTSGVGGINLALVLGATRVLLLGFDGQPDSKGRPNWHNRLSEVAWPGIYDSFVPGFTQVAADLPRVFPGCEIINLTPGTKLTCFPTARLEDFL